MSDAQRVDHHLLTDVRPLSAPPGLGRTLRLEYPFAWFGSPVLAMLPPSSLVYLPTGRA